MRADPRVVPGGLVGAMFEPHANMVSTYRPWGSCNFGALPDAGPKCRHRPSQYAVRARIWISVHSGIRRRISSASCAASCEVPIPRSGLSTGTPSSSMNRSG